MYDAVIVGSGLAGLAAARTLSAGKVLLLERDSRPGGRVLTRWFNGLPYDLGALFASPVNLDGFRESSGVHPAAGRIGLHAEGRWHYGDTPTACIRSALAATPNDLFSTAAFAEGRRDARQLPERALAVLNAFHRVVHPSDAQSCIPPRQRDGLVTLQQGFPAAGNGALVESLLQSLPGERRTGADVLRVDDHGGWVRVEFREQEQVRIVRSRAVIIATPPAAARAMLPNADEDVQRFLSGVHFRPGHVATVIVGANDVAPLNYCVATDLPFNTVVRCHREPDNHVSLHVYYLGSNHEALAETPSEDQAALVVDHLVAAGLLTRQASVAHVDVVAWAGIGPEISVEAYGQGVRWRVSRRVFLAGDYTWFDGENPFPFGMKAAVASGQRAGAAVSALLAGTDASAGSRNTSRPVVHPKLVEPLLHGSVYSLTAEAPAFLRHVSEGNVAFYGMLLHASGDPWIKDYLESCAVNGLWEFHTGFGVTAADSAIVLEGLLARGGDSPVVRYAAQRLVADFYDADAGAFRTVNGGRAAYWQGPSVETTAHVAYLLHSIDSDAWRDVVSRCTQYVRRAQEKPGHWDGKWYPSHVIPTYYAVRLLRHAAIDRSAQRLLKARNWLVGAQQKNGAWSNLVIDTAAAILTLREIGGAEKSLEMGLDWLQSRMKGHDIAGEPVLYYWYDDEDSKRFFTARDASGRIARAWAALALHMATGAAIG